MKILYMTDTHIRGTTPRSRTDDFPQTIYQKLVETMEIAEREQVDAILHGGDIFHSPNLSPAVVRQFADLFHRASAPIYAIAGNHDIYGHNPQTVPRTMLGLLDAFGAIRLLDSENPLLLEKKGTKVQVTGTPFHYDLDKRPINLDYTATNSTNADYCIHMVHGMLVDRTFPEGVAHTTIQQVWELETDWDILLTGHYHAGFEMQTRQGKYIVNPGALARIHSQKAEMNRMPQVVLMDFTDGMRVELIPLTCAQKGIEIMDRSALEKAAFRDQQLQQFMQQVGASSEYKGITAKEIIEQISQSEGIEEAIKQDALRRLAEAEEEEGGDCL